MDEKARETISRELNIFIKFTSILYKIIIYIECRRWNFKVHEKLEEYYDYVSDTLMKLLRILTLGYELVKLSDYAQNATLKKLTVKVYVEESLNIV